MPKPKLKPKLKQDKESSKLNTKLSKGKIADKSTKSGTTQQSKLTDKKRSGNYGPLTAVLVTIFTYVFAQILAVVLLAVMAPVFGYQAEEILEDLSESTVLQTLYIVIFQAVTLYILWLFLKLKSIPLKKIGLGRLPKSSDLSYAAITFIAYFVVLIALTSVVSNVFTSIDTEQQQQLGFENVINTTDLILVFISLVILPPIVEEILIRGYLYTGLRAKFTKIWSAIIASVIFGIAHLQLGSGEPPLWIAAIDTTVLSLFLIYLREKTGSLWSGMIVHAFKNGLAFMFLFVFKVI